MLDFSKDIANIYLAYNLFTNNIVKNNPLLFHVFNVKVIYLWNNVLNQNIQTFNVILGV